MESTDTKGTLVLDEILDPGYSPTIEEVWTYAVEKLQMAPDVNMLDKSLLYIARDALTQPLPKGWKICQQRSKARPGTVQTYYFNFKTGASSWEHPCDARAKRRLRKARRQQGIASASPTNSGARSKKRKKSRTAVTENGATVKPCSLPPPLPPPAFASLSSSLTSSTTTSSKSSWSRDSVSSVSSLSIKCDELTAEQGGISVEEQDERKGYIAEKERKQKEVVADTHGRQRVKTGESHRQTSEEVTPVASHSNASQHFGAFLRSPRSPLALTPPPPPPPPPAAPTDQHFFTETAARIAPGDDSGCGKHGNHASPARLSLPSSTEDTAAVTVTATGRLQLDRAVFSSDKDGDDLQVQMVYLDDDDGDGDEDGEGEGEGYDERELGEASRAFGAHTQHSSYAYDSDARARAFLANYIGKGNQRTSLPKLLAPESHLNHAAHDGGRDQPYNVTIASDRSCSSSRDGEESREMREVTEACTRLEVLSPLSPLSSVLNTDTNSPLTPVSILRPRKPSADTAGSSTASYVEKRAISSSRDARTAQRELANWPHENGNELGVGVDAQVPSEESSVALKASRIEDTELHVISSSSSSQENTEGLPSLHIIPLLERPSPTAAEEAQVVSEASRAAPEIATQCNQEPSPRWELLRIFDELLMRDVRYPPSSYAAASLAVAAEHDGAEVASDDSDDYSDIGSDEDERDAEYYNQMCRDDVAHNGPSNGSSVLAVTSAAHRGLVDGSRGGACRAIKPRRGGHSSRRERLGLLHWGSSRPLSEWEGLTVEAAWCAEGDHITGSQVDEKVLFGARPPSVSSSSSYSPSPSSSSSSSSPLSSPTVGRKPRCKPRLKFVRSPRSELANRPRRNANASSPLVGSLSTAGNPWVAQRTSQEVSCEVTRLELPKKGLNRAVVSWSRARSQRKQKGGQEPGSVVGARRSPLGMQGGGARRCAAKKDDEDAGWSWITRTGVAIGVGVPKSIGLLRGLRVLDLYGNGLVGPVPHEIGNLGGSLTRLNLGCNKLTGSIPVELAQCGKLSHLSLFDNRLSGDLPTSLIYHWIKDGSLKYVNLSGNPLLLLAAYDPSFHVARQMEGLRETWGGGPVWKNREDFIAWQAYDAARSSRSSSASGSAVNGKGPMVAGLTEQDLCGAPNELFRKLHQRYGAASMASAARGLVAVTEGDLQMANVHYTRALEEADTSKMPMLQALAARDLLKQVLYPLMKKNNKAAERDGVGGVGVGVGGGDDGGQKDERPWLKEGAYGIEGEGEECDASQETSLSRLGGASTWQRTKLAGRRALLPSAAKPSEMASEDLAVSPTKHANNRGLHAKISSTESAIDRACEILEKSRCQLGIGPPGNP